MQTIKGKIRGDKKTKNLVKRLEPGDIALINHEDLDEVAARSLVEKKVKAVINTQSFISGKYPNQGPQILEEAGVLLIEIISENIWDIIEEGQEVIIKNGDVYLKNELIINGQIIDSQKIAERMEIAKANFNTQVESFAENTLTYAKKELDLILKELQIPPIKTKIKGRQCLIVVRGQNYKKDLKAIRTYINEVKPVIIGVDGGADAILEEGLQPDIIIGDMDSVSDKALKCGAEIIVHAYPDGSAPGLARVEKLGLKGKILPAYGTSEDVAMLLAYQKGATLIVAVGTHSNIIDFLEKGRKGMGSTFLVRLKVGNILIDARGVSLLYKQKVRFKYLFQIVAAALIPVIIVFLTSQPTYQLLRLFFIKLKVLLQI